MSETMRKNANGNVGMRTTTPRTLLEIDATDSNGFSATRWSGTLSNGVKMHTGSTETSLVVWQNDGVGNMLPSLVLSTTTPGFTGTEGGAVSADFMQLSYDPLDLWATGISGGSSAIVSTLPISFIDKDSGIPTMVLNVAGHRNVGIGTTTPTFNLEVT